MSSPFEIGRRTPDFVPSSRLTPGQQKVEYHNDVLASLDPLVASWMTDAKYIKPVREVWQPSDFLPAFEDDEKWPDQLSSLRKNAAKLPDNLLAVLVGDAGTEEALPTYQTAANRHAGVRDITGADESGWAQWTRSWTGEENRHGDLLNTYLRLSGRVHMGEVERTIQSLITNGFDPKFTDDPYKFTLYASFQERATKFSHRNAAKLARDYGAPDLGVINATIAGDENRHERFYTDVGTEIFNRDPEGSVIAYRDLLKDQIVMPAARMTEGEKVPAGKRQTDLFDRFAMVAHDSGIYTAAHYVEIAQHLNRTWNIPNLSVSGEAAKAQDELGKYTDEYGKRVDRLMTRRAQRTPNPTFSWIYGREVPLSRE